MDLAAIPWRPTRHPGIAVHFYASDQGTGRVLALIRMDPGCGYPRHRHRGPERVLVLQGGYDDEHGRHPAGAFVDYAPDSAHHPRAIAGAVPCVLLALAPEGVELAPA
ncbi:MAG: cupin domain-containing protein [Planctomycetes bacterium]|nr:cupin domain-containing protein [Planctomycetota bacterium]